MHIIFVFCRKICNFAENYSAMAVNMNKDLKLYYSISEVAEMFGVAESALRYWEKVFTHIRPKTTAAGARQYTKENIEQIRVVHNLVKVRGYKLEAAKKMLAQNRKGVEKSSEILTRLIEARDELKQLKKQLDTIQE